MAENGFDRELCLDQLGLELMAILGLPRRTRKAVITISANDWVTVTCEYNLVPEDRKNDEITKAIAHYELRPKEAPPPAP